MNTVFRIITLWLICCLTVNAHSQQSLMQFPEDWLGRWYGELNIYQGQKINQTLPMQIIVSPSDSTDQYTWSLIYGADSIAGLRAYTIKPINKSIGHYVIDEHNSILIDAYIQSDALISSFDVMGANLTAIYRRQDDELIFEIIVHRSKPIRTTGNTDEIPKVDAFPVTSYQKAILKRRL